MSKYCIDIKSNQAFFEDLGKKFNMPTNYIAYILNEYLIENDLTIDDFALNDDNSDFFEYINHVRENNEDVIKAKNISYVANIFKLTLNKELKGKTSDIVVDIADKIISIADEEVKDFNEKNPERKMSFEDYVRKNFQHILSRSYYNFNMLRCIYSGRINDLNENLKELKEKQKNGDPNGNIQKEIDEINGEINEREEQVRYLSSLLKTENWSALCMMAKKRISDFYEFKIYNNEKENNEAVDEEYSEEDDEDFENVFDIEAKPKDGFVEKDMISRFKTASKKVKKYLSRIPTGQKTVLGFDKFYPPKTMFYEFLDVLRGIKSSDELIQRLENHANEILEEDEKNTKGLYIINNLIDDLRNDNKLKTSFFVAFSLVNKDFYDYRISKNGDVYEINSRKLNKVYESEIFESARRNIYGNELKIEGDFEELKKNILQITGLIDVNEGGVLKRFISLTPKTKKKLIVDLFNKLHLINKYNQKEIDNYLTKMLWSRDNNSLRDFVWQLSYLVQNFNDQTKFWKKDMTEEEYNAINLNIKKGQISIKNVEETLEKAFLVLERFNDKKVYARTASIINDRKQRIDVYCDQLPSYMTQLEQDIKDIANETDEKGALLPKETRKEHMRDYFKRKYLCSRFFKTTEDVKTVNDNGEEIIEKKDIILNKWIDDLIEELDDPYISFERSFAANFTTRINVDINKKHVKNFSDKDVVLQQLSGFIVGEGNSRNTRFWWCPIFILGDSQSNQSIKVRKYGEYDKDGNFDYSEIIDALYNVYIQEVQRDKIIESLDKDQIPEEYRKKYGKCTILPFINEEMKKNPNVIVPAIQDYLDDLALEFFHKILDYGLDSFLSSLNKDKHSFRNFKKVMEVYNDKERENYDEDLRNAIANSDIMNFVANMALAKAMELEFFDVDNAFFVSTKDLQKRNKSNYANGSSIDVATKDNEGNNVFELDEYGEAYQKAIYFNEIRLNAEDTDPDFMKSIIYQFSTDKQKAKEFIDKGVFDEKEIRNLIGDYYYKNVYEKYKKNKVTDGQAYRTLDSYRKIAMGLDKWSDEAEELYNKIKKMPVDGELTDSQIKEIQEIQVYLQPLKLHGRFNEQVKIENSPNEYFIVPTEHKYAEIVLIPQLLKKDSLLKKMALFMDENKIDLCCSNSCVKFGSFGEAKFQTDKESYGENNVYDVLSKARVHKLNISGLKQQTNVPYHLNDDNLFGTQSRKLVLNSINKNKKYDVLERLGFDGNIKISENKSINAQNFNGVNYFSFYDSLIAANQLTSYNKFKEKIFSIDDNGNYSLDFEKISELLVENGLRGEKNSITKLFEFLTVNGEIVRDFFDYLAEEKEDFVIPFNEGSIAHEAFSLLASLFKKYVNKQMILGGSAVQASAFGFDGIETDYSGTLKTHVVDNNVIEVECIIPFDFTVTDHRERRIKLDYSKYCNKDGTFKTDSHGNTKIELDYPGILDLVAYRIPTEREYSMIKLKVKQCDLSVNGGTIKVPQQYTTVAGFDFDIDKLYLMRKEFKLIKPDFEKLIQNKEDWFKLKEEIIDYLRENPETSKYISEFSADKMGYTGGINGELWKIWGEIYRQEPEVKRILKRDKKISGNEDAFLNNFFDSSFKIKELAAKRGFSSVKEFKNHLFANAVMALGYSQSIVKQGKRYYDFNKDLMIQEGIEEKDLINKAAQELGVVFKWNKNEGKYEKYDQNKTILENTTVSRNNLILELIKDRLQDPDSFKGRYFPGGFAELSDIARYNRYNEKFINDNENPISYAKFLNTISDKEDILEDEDILNPLTHVKYQIQNAIASKLIGLFANHNTNYSLSLLMDEMYLSDEDAIRFGKQSDISGNQSFIEKDENIARRVAELLAASVDAVKDPVFSYLNINLTTANITATLVRLGYDFEDISLLLNQPIIKEVCRVVNDNDKYLDVALTEIKKKFEEEDIISEDDYNITSDELLDGLKDDIYTRSQYNVLNLFIRISSVSKELNSFVRSSRYTAANSVGSTIGDFLEQDFVESTAKYEKIKMKFNDEITIPIINTDSENLTEDQYIEKYFNNPLLFEQCAYDCSKKFISGISRLFGYKNNVYKSVINEFNLMAQNLNRKIDAETYNNIVRMIPDYILSKTEGLFNPRTMIKYNEEEMTIREYYNEHFVDDFIDFRDKHKDLTDKYEILSKIIETTIKSKSGQEYRLLKIDYRNYVDEKYSTDNITNSWAAMLYDENEQVRNLARQLFYYSFHIAGTSMNVFSFISLAPYQVKLQIPVDQNISYREFFRSVRDGNVGINIEDFMNDFILNNLENKFMVRQIYDKSIKELFNGNVVNITLNKNNEEDWYAINYLTNTNGDSTYSFPVVKIGNSYYKSVNNEGKIRTFIGSKDDYEIQIKYEKINPPALAEKVLYLSGNKREASQFDYRFIDRNVTSINDETEDTLNEDYENSVQFLREMLDDLYDEDAVDITKEEGDELNKLIEDKNYKSLFYKLISIVDNANIDSYFKNNIISEAVSKLYYVEDIEDEDFENELNNLLNTNNEFKNIYEKRLSEEKDLLDENFNHFINGIINYYRKNGNFVVNVDGKQIKLC